jgi:hypothetical protein
MAVLGLLHVEWYPVHWDHMQGNLPESCKRHSIAWNEIRPNFVPKPLAKRRRGAMGRKLSPEIARPRHRVERESFAPSCSRIR